MKPWINEPDREEFKHLGFDCLLNRNMMGAWCGYTAVKPDHPYYGKGYDDVEIEVHGGLTYAHECQGEVCHEAEDDKAWWFGFDCAHAYDLVPVADKARDEKTRQAWITHDLKAFNGDHGEIYRDINYVRDQTKGLALQLSQVINEA